MDDTAIIENTVRTLEEEGRFGEEKSCIQHGTATVYDHSISVAEKSLSLAEKFRAPVNTTELVRGALLHDYFLYDWHVKKDRPKWHGFTHPSTALKNAETDYALSAKEKDIIARHMFPLTPVPPRYKESWIVCLADKRCAAEEYFSYRFGKKEKETDA